MKRTFNRIAFLQALTLLLVLLPFVGGAAYVWHKHQWAQGQLADLEPRHARLQGLLASQGKLEEAEKAIQAELAKHAYPASQDTTQAGNDAQQRIRSLFADNKLDIASLQVLPPKEEKHFDRIPIVLRVEGELPGIQSALAALSAQTPTVVTESVFLQTVGVVKPASAQKLSGQFNFYVLRGRS